MSFAYLAPAFQLFEALFSGSIDAIKSSVALNNPTSISAVVFTGFVAYCFLGGLITNTHSFVDQLWSISPIVYAVIYAYLASGEPRVLIMAAIVTAWGVRLTYNFARKGKGRPVLLICI